MSNLTITSAGAVAAPLGKIGVYSDLGNGAIYNQGSIVGGGGGSGVTAQAGVVVTGATSLINSGYVAGGYSQYNAAAGVITTALVDNYGTITGGAGKDFAGAGGVGVALNNATLQNQGKVFGGEGLGGSGGDGVSGTGYVYNDGSITGGLGYLKNFGGGGVSEGGIGVSLTGGLTNSGVITGGAAETFVTEGYGGAGVSINPDGGTASNSGLIKGGVGYVGGAGVVLTGFGTFVNTGDIIGGFGKFDGGAGLDVLGSMTVIDSGFVQGFSGGYSDGDAIQFGTNADTLILEPGARLDGLVAANPEGHDVLEVAGTSSVAVSGIGEFFTGFNQISFAAGAERTISGFVGGLAAGQTISGFSGRDAVILYGFSASNASLVAAGIELSNNFGGTVTIDLIRSASNNIEISSTSNATTILAPAGPVELSGGEIELTAAGGTTHNDLVAQAGTLIVYAGGNAVNSTVAVDGTVMIDSGGIATSATIAGGQLDLLPGASAAGSINFVGQDGTLIIGGTVMPMVVISGFVTSDEILLPGLPYQQGASASVTAPGTVTVVDGTQTAVLHIAGTTLGEAISFGSGSELSIGGSESIISGTLGFGVTLGSGGFGSNLTITGTIVPVYGTVAVTSTLPSGYILNEGRLTGAPVPQNYHIYAADGVSISGGVSLTNAGTIAGGAGNPGRYAFDSGAAGVVTTGNVDNLASGVILGGRSNPYYGDGGNGVDITNAGLQNAGTIIGGAGPTRSDNYGRGNYGGTGVYGSDVLINSGTIIGGLAAIQGYPFDPHYGGPGFGVKFSGTVINSGFISGGNSSEFLGGGSALYLHGGYLKNTGTLVGGASPHGGGFGAILGVDARAVNQGIIRGQNGGDGGEGVLLSKDDTFTNYGFIAGGNATFSGSNAGGAGVNISGGAALINSGTIVGGVGVPLYGTTQVAAVLFGSGVNTLVSNPGAVFEGNIVGSTRYADVLEVAGTSSVVFGGIGTQFTGFDDIAFATLAVRTIAGDVAGLAAGQTITGFAGHDAIILDGFAETSAALTASGVELISGGTTAALDIVFGAAKNIVVSQSAGNTTLTAPAGTATLTFGETELTASGGTSHNTRIDSGGTLIVYAGGTASTPIIAGGELILNAGGHFSGAVDFTGTGGLLAIGGTVMPANVISGFVAGDTIQLTGLPYKAGAAASVSSPGHVVIHDGAVTEKLNIAGTTLGEPLVFGPGSVLTVGTAQMAFLAPETAAARENWFGGSVMVETPAVAPLFVSSAVHFGAGPDLVETVHKGGAQGFVVLPHG